MHTNICMHEFVHRGGHTILGNCKCIIGCGKILHGSNESDRGWGVGTQNMFSTSIPYM